MQPSPAIGLEQSRIMRELHQRSMPFNSCLHALCTGSAQGLFSVEQFEQ